MNELSLKCASTQNFIEQLTQWTTKHTLNNDISSMIKVYHTQITQISQMSQFSGYGAPQINFAEAGLFIQGCSTVHGKNIDLLHKKLFELNLILNQMLSTGKPEETDQNEENKNSQNTKLGEKELKGRKKSKKDKNADEEKKQDETNTDNNAIVDTATDETNKEVSATDEANTEVTETTQLPDDEAAKISIPGIPDDIIKELKLTDCLTGGPIDECIDRLDQTHPLYAVFKKLGNEITKSKEIFTYNNISLSGLSWNALYILEKYLNKNAAKNDDNLTDLNTTDNIFEDIIQDSIENNNEGISITFDKERGINVERMTDTNNETTTVDNNAELSVNNTVLLDKELKVTLEPLSNEILEEYQMKKNCKVPLKEIKINLFHLPRSILLRKTNFKLPDEFFKPRYDLRGVLKKVKLKRGNDEANNEEEPIYKRLKTFDLQAFEDFCQAEYEKEGIIPSRISRIERKSIDNTSEISFGCPVTPDSGRFSLSCSTDNEFDFHDEMDINVNINNDSFTRSDSALPMSPLIEHIDHNDLIDKNCSIFTDSGVEDMNESSDPTLQTLKTLFPNTFSDPNRAEIVKKFIKPDQVESENYLQWKKFIDDKMANEKEFDIHEYGTDILRSFPNKCPNEVISFQSVVDNKSVQDISRYFVSALQLANTGNVEIIERCPGQIRPDNLHFKFITEERYHEDLDTFSLPSEAEFVKNVTSTQEMLHSTPVHDFNHTNFAKKPAKRRKIDYAY